METSTFQAHFWYPTTLTRLPTAHLLQILLYLEAICGLVGPE